MECAGTAYRHLFQVMKNRNFNNVIGLQLNNVINFLNFYLS